jgi:transposase-like protein
MTIHELCGPWRPRAIARVRARLIRAAAERGYRTSEIARFFAVSPGLVSQAKYSRSLVKN